MGPEKKKKRKKEQEKAQPNVNEEVLLQGTRARMEFYPVEMVPEQRPFSLVGQLPTGQTPEGRICGSLSSGAINR